ncbi:hypothetical protein [Motilimonas pumila]|uniref:Uncharacterized protein n=1 Tax=Motilimonas pumila TaxID=2303987 RepID=A0A418YHK3_9GAMM|nr:hypothetical protein [Motilimonas pumila]RJG49880.1 hypothetical protein D1Z90_04335 [Motilimonas pumila]
MLKKLTLVCVIASLSACLDPESLAEDRLHLALDKIEQAESATTDVARKRLYYSALSDVSKLQKQFPETRVFKQLSQGVPFDVSNIEARVLHANAKGAGHVTAPTQTIDYFSLALRLNEQQPEFAQLRGLLTIWQGLQRVPDHPERAAVLPTLLNLTAKETEARLLCQAYQAIGLVEAEHDAQYWASRITDLLEQQLNQKDRASCAQAYFTLAESQVDVAALSKAWGIRLADNQSQQAVALAQTQRVKDGIKVAQAIADPLQQAQTFVAMLTSAPEFGPFSEQLLGLSLTSVDTLKATEQKEQLYLLLQSYLLAQQVFGPAAQIHPLFKTPLNQAHSLSNISLFQYWHSQDSQYLAKLEQSYQDYLVARQAAEKQIGFHELMDIWLNEQIKASSLGVYQNLSQAHLMRLFRQPENPQAVTERLQELYQNSPTDIRSELGFVPVMIQLSQQQNIPKQNLTGLSNQQAERVLAVLLKSQDQTWITTWLNLDLPVDIKTEHLLQFAKVSH